MPTPALCQSTRSRVFDVSIALGSLTRADENDVLITYPGEGKGTTAMVRLASKLAIDVLPCHAAMHNYTAPV